MTTALVIENLTKPYKMVCIFKGINSMWEQGFYNLCAKMAQVNQQNDRHLLF